MTKLEMKNRKISYYAVNIARDFLPSFIFRRRMSKILGSIEKFDADDIVSRVNYYNKIGKNIEIDNNVEKINSISMGKSFYYYDFKEHARYFSRKFRLKYEFGDVLDVPDQPAFVKSRPILGDNANSLIMKMDKLRHFYFPPDPIAFEEKRPLAVWRGGEHNPKRVALMCRYRGHRLCDVGYTHVGSDDSRHSPFLHPVEQMAYRYIISIEGNDVASNLKWILSSNSLCLMPEPAYETWFMEGRLKAGEHYVGVADDFEDLEDKILYYESHPAEAQEIIRNANRYVTQFLDEPREQLVSILVLYKYFVATGQLEPERSVARLLWP